MHVSGNLSQSQHIVQTTRHTLFACYAQQSLNKDFSNSTYIGFTNNPLRRFRQHNGEIKNGAKKTRKARPWAMSIVVHGFPSHHSALQFEWAWQNPKHSKILKAYMSGVKVKRGFEGLLTVLNLQLNSRLFRMFPQSVQCTSPEVYTQVLVAVQPPAHMQIVQDCQYSLPCYDGFNTDEDDVLVGQGADDELDELDEQQDEQNGDDEVSKEYDSYDENEAKPFQPSVVKPQITNSSIAIDTPIVLSSSHTNDLCDVCLNETSMPPAPQVTSIPAIFTCLKPSTAAFPLDFLIEKSHSRAIKVVFCYYCGTQYHTICALRLCRQLVGKTQNEKESSLLKSFTTPKKAPKGKKGVDSATVDTMQPKHTHELPGQANIFPLQALELGPIPLAMHCCGCKKLLIWAKLLQVATNDMHRQEREEIAVAKKKSKKPITSAHDLDFIDEIVLQMNTQHTVQSQPTELCQSPHTRLKRMRSALEDTNLIQSQKPLPISPQDTPPLTQRLAAAKFKSMHLEE